MHSPRFLLGVRISGIKQRMYIRGDDTPKQPPGKHPVQRWRNTMKLQHRVQINVAQGREGTQGVLGSRGRKLPARLLRFLFGQYSEVLVLTPGKTVRSVEIHEMQEGVNGNGR